MKTLPRSRTRRTLAAFAGLSLIITACADDETAAAYNDRDADSVGRIEIEDGEVDYDTPLENDLERAGQSVREGAERIADEAHEEAHELGEDVEDGWNELERGADRLGDEMAAEASEIDTEDGFDAHSPYAYAGRGTQRGNETIEAAQRTSYRHDATTRPGADRESATMSLEALDMRRSGPGQIRAGQEFTYEIHVSNTTEQPLHGVVVRERVESEGAGFRIVKTEAGTDPHGWDGEESPRSMPASFDASGTDSREARPRGEQERQARSDAPTSSRESSARTSESANEESSQHTGEVRFEKASKGLGGEWHIGSLKPGESRVLTVTARTDETGTMRSCLTAEYERGLCTSFEAVAPELSLAQSVVAPDAVYACDDISVTYRITNDGGAPAEGLRIREDLPEWLTTQDGSASVDMDVETVPAGQTIEKTVVLRASRAGEFQGNARVQFGDEAMTASTDPVRILQPELELTVDGPEQGFQDTPLTYTVTIENTSDDPARDVVLTAAMPQGFTAEQFSFETAEAQDDEGESVHRNAQQSGNSFSIQTLEAGQKASFRVTLTPDREMTLSPTFRASAYCVDEMTKSFDTEVVGIPAVLIEVVDKQDPVQVGNTTIYEIRVKNQGTEDGIDIQLTAKLPEHFEYVGFEGGREVNVDGRNLTFSPIPSLAPGAEEVWLLEARAVKAGKTRLTVKMTSEASSGKPIVEQEPTTVFE